MEKSLKKKTVCGGHFKIIFKSKILKITIFKERANPGPQVTASTEFRTVALNVCGSSVYDWLWSRF
jgi:hypothetical protein